METRKHKAPSAAKPLRLGFPVKVVGRKGLKSNDTRRWQKNPHLRTSIEYLHAIFDYLATQQIDMKAPPLVGHADFLNPFEFATFMRSAGKLEFDVMLEAKMKDVALLRLRRDLARCAPDVAARFQPRG